MADIFMTIRVKAVDQVAAQNTVASIPGCSGMFTVGFTTDAGGLGAPTHYITSGWTPEEVQSVMWPSSAEISYVPDTEVQGQLDAWGMHRMWVGD
jgi:hypothetical protein